MSGELQSSIKTNSAEPVNGTHVSARKDPYCEGSRLRVGIMERPCGRVLGQAGEYSCGGCEFYVGPRSPQFTRSGEHPMTSVRWNKLMKKHGLYRGDA